MAYLEKIVKQSPWLLDSANIDNDVHLQRLQAFPLIYKENDFLEYTFEDGVYIVTGPRQIGKSTHIKLLVKKYLTESLKTNFLYFNCDLLDKKQEIVDVVEEYLNEYPSSNRRFVLLDEITVVKNSFLAIKYLVDSGHYANITYILTGSNTISIKKTGEYLPGRRGKGIDFHFKPLSFKNYIKLLSPNLNLNISISSHSLQQDLLSLKSTFNFKRHFEHYLITGGFPRVINEFYLNNSIGDDIFTIYRSWLTSEIAKSDKKQHIAKLILERCLFSLSSDMSYNAFAQDIGIGSHNTIYDYLDFLSNAFVITIIYHYDLHQKKVNYRKNKKIYFNDPFIYSVIEAWLSGKPKQNYNYLQDPVRKSKLIENIVATRLTELCNEIYFTKTQQEVDFIANKCLAEVKYQNRIVPKDYAFIKSQPSLNSGYKLVLTKDLFKIDGDILLLPVDEFLICDLS